MKRRTLLGCFGAMALRSAAAAGAEAPGLRVVVVRAGIIGASIAWHLARAGITVTVLDRQGPATCASRGTFAWLNATWAKQPRDYHRLNQRGIAGWKRLQRALALPVRWGGSLEWFAGAERARRLSEQHARCMLDVATAFVPALAGARFERVDIGWRPLPLDGHPVLGFSPVHTDVYLAITHSGVTLAPIVGELGAELRRADSVA